jgi:hypothetical protein
MDENVFLVKIYNLFVKGLYNEKNTGNQDV